MSDLLDIERQLDTLLAVPQPTLKPVTLDKDGVPDVPRDYWQPQETPMSGGMRTWLREWSGMDRGEQLEALIDLSLERKLEILQLAFDPFDENYLKLVQIVDTAASDILRTGVKVDENRFRKRSASALIGILEKLTNAEQLQRIA